MPDSTRLRIQVRPRGRAFRHRARVFTTFHRTFIRVARIDDTQASTPSFRKNTMSRAVGNPYLSAFPPRCEIPRWNHSQFRILPTTFSYHDSTARSPLSGNPAVTGRSENDGPDRLRNAAMPAGCARACPGRRSRAAASARLARQRAQTHRTGCDRVRSLSKPARFLQPAHVVGCARAAATVPPGVPTWP